MSFFDTMTLAEISKEKGLKKRGTMEMGSILRGREKEAQRN